MYHGVAHTHAFENTRRKIKYRVDTYGLLEHAEHDADEDDHPAVSKQFFGFFVSSGFDVGQNDFGLSYSVDTAQNRERFFVTTGHCQITGRFGNEQYEQ